jgi:hypothetical protein
MVAAAIEWMWSTSGESAGMDPNRSPTDALYDVIAELVPQTDSQRSLRAQALSLALHLTRTRMLLLEQQGSSIPAPFLVVLIFWLTVIFASFGLFAPANATVVTVFVVSVLSMSGAIFLILELDRSFCRDDPDFERAAAPGAGSNKPVTCTDHQCRR